jgi:two-component system sensor histidine kinase/response regulator
MLDRPGLLDRLDGDEPLMHEMAVLFLEECPSMLDAVRDGICQGDTHLVQRAAHALKGALLSLSADPVAQTSGQLETLADAGELERCRTLVALLELQIERLQSELRLLAS